MIGIEKILIDPLNIDNNQRINQSDHYALQLIINFRTRSISHRSALVILPTLNTWSLIHSYNDQEDILLRLRLLLSPYPSFAIKINEID
ncbi:unnamed protein product, partial [Rotaria sp. Silwood1]